MKRNLSFGMKIGTGLAFKYNIHQQREVTEEKRKKSGFLHVSDTSVPAENV